MHQNQFSQKKSHKEGFLKSGHICRSRYIMVISLLFMTLNMTGCIDGLLCDAVPAATLQMRSSL